MTPERKDSDSSDSTDQTTPASPSPPTEGEGIAVPTNGDSPEAPADPAPAESATGDSPLSPLIRPSCVRRLARWLMILASIGGVVWLFWAARVVLAPFVIGLVLAYLLLPMVNRLERHLPRWVAILVVYIGCLLLLIGFAAILLPLLWYQFLQLANSVPDITLDNLQQQASELLGQYRSKVPQQLRQPVEEGIIEAFNSLQMNMITYARRFGTFIFNYVLQVINTVIFLLGFVIVPIWMFYILKDYQSVYQFINRAIPARTQTDFWAVVKIIDRILSSYIRGQVLLGVIVGCGAGLGLSILSLFGFEMKYILLLAVFAGIMELIPIIGPIIGAIPAITLGLFESPFTALAVLILYLFIQLLENNVLVPRIIGESIGLHPALTILLMVIAGQLFGILGVILIAPVAAISRDIFLYLYGRLADEPAPAGVLPHSVPEERLNPFEEREGEPQPLTTTRQHPAHGE